MRNRNRFGVGAMLLVASAVVAAACSGDAGEAGAPGPAGPPGPAGAAGTGASTDAAVTSADPATTLLRAFGGKAAIGTLASLTSKADGRAFIVGEGYLPTELVQASTFTVATAFDFTTGNVRLDYTRKVFAFGGKDLQYSELLRKDGGVRIGVDGLLGAPGGPMPADRWASGRRQQRLLHPEVLAREIALDPTLAVDAGAGVVAGALQRKISIADPVAPIVLFVDATSGVLTKLETVENEHRSGDLPLEVFFDEWAPIEGAVVLPRRVVMTLGGQVVHEERRREVASVATLAPGTFDPPSGSSLGPTDAADVTRGEKSAQFHQQWASIALPFDGYQVAIAPVELSPGVWHIRGGTHNSMVVEQQAGVVVVEAPLYPERSEAVLAWIKANIPGKPVTHVIATHFHQDHSGGLRSFVAAGARIVAGEAGIGYFEDAIRTPRRIQPDVLSGAPRPAIIEGLAPGAMRTLADPVRPVSVYTVDTIHAAGMVIAVVGTIVFVSDIFSPGLGNVLGKQTLEELRSTIATRGISVTTFAGGHGVTATPADLDALIAASTF